MKVSQVCIAFGLAALSVYPAGAALITGTAPVLKSDFAGTVTNAFYKHPVDSATVILYKVVLQTGKNPQITRIDSALTDASGIFSFRLLSPDIDLIPKEPVFKKSSAGFTPVLPDDLQPLPSVEVTYEIRAHRAGYYSKSVESLKRSTNTVVVDIELIPLVQHDFAGDVKDAKTHRVVKGAQVYLCSYSTGRDSAQSIKKLDSTKTDVKGIFKMNKPTGETAPPVAEFPAPIGPVVIDTDRNPDISTIDRNPDRISVIKYALMVVADGYESKTVWGFTGLESVSAFIEISTESSVNVLGHNANSEGITHSRRAAVVSSIGVKNAVMSTGAAVYSIDGKMIGAARMHNNSGRPATQIFIVR